GQLGLQTEFRRGKWLLTMAGQVALGDLHQELEISGISTLQQEPPDPFTGEPGTISGVQGGLLANAGNIGRTTRDEFGVLPEFTCNLACQITPNLSAFVGYNVIWLGDVVRAGAQINPRINPGLVPTSFAYGQSGFVGANPPTMVE